MEVTASDLEAARQRYAEMLRDSVPISNPHLVTAFATVEREAFQVSPPWDLIEPGVRVVREAVDDPRALYNDVLVRIDRLRGINNGQPRLWALLLDQAQLRSDDRVLHIGAGLGYYTAIIAKALGSTGSVLAIEREPDLARQAAARLKNFDGVEVIEADGAIFEPGPVDVVIASAGGTHPADQWLDALRAEGRLVMPLTDQHGQGAFWLFQRREEGLSAKWLCNTAIYPLDGLRDREAGERLSRALALDRFPQAQSLRRDPQEADGSACYIGPNIWLSSRPLGA